MVNVIVYLEYIVRLPEDPKLVPQAQIDRTRAYQVIAERLYLQPSGPDELNYPGP